MKTRTQHVIPGGPHSSRSLAYMQDMELWYELPHPLQRDCVWPFSSGVRQVFEAFDSDTLNHVCFREELQ